MIKNFNAKFKLQTRDKNITNNAGFALLKTIAEKQGTKKFLKSDRVVD